MERSEALRRIYANVAISQVDNGRGIYRFENRMQFVDLRDFPIEYRLTAGGKVLRSGVFRVSAAPGKAIDAVIPGVGGVNKDRKLVITVGNIACAEF